MLSLVVVTAFALQSSVFGAESSQNASPFPKRDLKTASFPHYPNREVYALEGAWDFTFLNYTDYNAMDPLPAGIEFKGTQVVPSAWDSAYGTGLQYSRGAGVYKTKVSVGANQPALLHFEACSLYCRVYVDGKMIANHTAGGYTPFWASVPASAVTDRTIVVMASNVFDPHGVTPTQMQNYDFYQYGGLIREVTLHVLPKAPLPYIQRVMVAPLGTKGNAPKPTGKVDVSVMVMQGDASAPTSGKVQLQLCWDIAATTPCSATTVPYKEYTYKNNVVSIPAITVPNAKVWDVATPSLHTLTVSAGVPKTKSTSTNPKADTADVYVVQDSIQVRFGLRIVAAAGRQILVNGKAVKLHGYNRHDLYPQVGPSMTTEMYDADLELIQTKLNSNFIRGSHYPQDPRFLDRCDERGMLVWEEALAWGDSAKLLNLNSTFMKAELETANAMLDRDTNHPAIIMWGFFNEAQSDVPQACPAYKAMSDTFHGRDPTRLVTWADNRLTKGLCYEHADVISNNAYPGWYTDSSSTAAAFWERQAAWVAENYPTKPFIISETGAGAILSHVGNDTHATKRWSQEYERKLDDILATVAMQDANISGITMWQFCDIKVDATNSSTRRPGGINNKGVVSKYRVPKLAAAAVAAAYAKAD